MNSQKSSNQQMYQQTKTRPLFVTLTVAFLAALALSTFIQSLVNDLLLGSNLSSLFLVVKYPSEVRNAQGPSAVSNAPTTFAAISTSSSGESTPIYNTIAQAQLAGAFTWNYGLFLTNLINLLSVVLVGSLMVKFTSRKVVTSNSV
ncbi:hypothetical protein MIR68_007874 [Amoeboaphelidium protococcarum]|nr:hypothetical protein MIR68_007874 [Amoeboaphelidium protococcarum]